MNVKRYIAEDIPKAMDRIREELGRDAFILNTRKVRRRGVFGLFQKPLVEVVAAYEQPPGAATVSEARSANESAVLSLLDAMQSAEAKSSPAFASSKVASGAYHASPQNGVQSPPQGFKAHAPTRGVGSFRAEGAAAYGPFSAQKDTFAVQASIGVPPAATDNHAGSRAARERALSEALLSAQSGPQDASAGAHGGAATNIAASSLLVPGAGTGVKLGISAYRSNQNLGHKTSVAPFRPATFDDTSINNSLDVVSNPSPDPSRLDSLETKLDTLSSAVNSLVGKMSLKTSDYPSGYTPEVESLVLSLLDNDVHAEFAHKIGKEVQDIVLRQKENPTDVMEQIIRQYLGEAAPIKLKRFKRTVVLFVGPTGVGKTTTLAKLSAIFTLNHHARVGIITTDTYRIAAVEQLKTYAEILDVPLTVVYAPEDVGEALNEHRERDIVFIDTAGKSPNDPTLETEILTLLKYSEADEVHLVLSSTTSFTGCLNIINTYSFLRDYKLLFTKMDETPTWGMLLNLKFLTERNISYMAAGQTVPDDIEVFDARKVISRLMGRETHE